MAPPSVCAVVVTHNRRDLLARCLDHLERQSRRPDAILVVDNASTDGTAELLAQRRVVDVVRSEVNVGGAGGFHRGIALAAESGHDWVWLMDDDVLCDERCLESLLAGAARAPRPPSLVTSAVRWRDGSLHPMNRPWLRLRPEADAAVAAREGLAPVRAATFVSTMVHRDAIARHGLPHAHYFVWLDDMEFTGRILRQEPGYIVPESVATHWTPRPHDTVADSGERFYFKARNHLWLLRGPSFGGLDRALYAVSYARAVVTYLRRSDDRRRALGIVARGVRDGLRAEPR